MGRREPIRKSKDKATGPAGARYKNLIRADASRKTDRAITQKRELKSSKREELKDHFFYMEG